MDSISERAKAVYDAVVKTGSAAADEFAVAVAKCIKGGGKVLLCGNGGSAADCQHFAAELVGRFELDRPAMAAVALTVDSSAITAVGNDFSFREVFSRQVEALGRRGDVLVCISTSGRSPNVLAAAEAAKSAGMTVASLTGDPNSPLAKKSDVGVHVAAGKTCHVQEGHLFFEHYICEAVEREIYGRD